MTFLSRKTNDVKECKIYNITYIIYSYLSLSLTSSHFYQKELTDRGSGSFRVKAVEMTGSQF